jgi:hypothetical protein
VGAIARDGSINESLKSPPTLMDDGASTLTGSKIVCVLIISAASNSSDVMVLVLVSASPSLSSSPAIAVETTANKTKFVKLYKA